MMMIIPISYFFIFSKKSSKRIAKLEFSFHTKLGIIFLSVSSVNTAMYNYIMQTPHNSVSRQRAPIFAYEMNIHFSRCSSTNKRAVNLNLVS